MEKFELDDFNEKIMKAFAKKAQKFEEKAEDLEKNLKVKEAELEYLAKLYNKEKDYYTLELENSKKKIELLETKKNKLEDIISSKDKKIEELELIVDKLNEEATAKDQKIEELELKVDKISEEATAKDQKIEELEANLETLETQISLKDKEISNYKDEAIEFSKQIGDLNQKISDNEIIMQEIKDETLKGRELIELQKEQIDSLKFELSEFKPSEMEEISKDRLVCPKCGVVGKDIKTIEDKSKALTYIGNMPMYAKIRVCKKCGHEI
ncbi:MAG: hypothetical protein GF353_19130 [Candidatus Lokiarchaeota archaeon]|nr:hypothetical protein [Candidatus Lokiarchaeota archaeon]